MTPLEARKKAGISVLAMSRLTRFTEASIVAFERGAEVPLRAPEDTEKLERVYAKLRELVEVAS